MVTRSRRVLKSWSRSHLPLSGWSRSEIKAPVSSLPQLLIQYNLRPSLGCVREGLWHELGDSAVPATELCRHRMEIKVSKWATVGSSRQCL